MSKYISNRQKNLKIGISSYTENTTALEVVGNVGIGTTNATANLDTDDIRVRGSFYDKDNQSGTTGQILVSTASGVDWQDVDNLESIQTVISTSLTGIEVKDEGGAIGTTFTSINFIGSGVTATASGTDANITFTDIWSENNSQTAIAYTGNVSVSGVITASSFSGSGAGLTSLPSGQLTGALPAIDGSALTGIASTELQFNNSGISIASTDGSIVLKSSDVVVATLSSTTAYWNVPLDLNSNKIVNLANPSSLSDAANKNYVDNQVTGDTFPTGDYGNLDAGQIDAFSQAISNLEKFDCLNQPSDSFVTTDLGVLT